MVDPFKKSVGPVFRRFYLLIPDSSPVFSKIFFLWHVIHYVITSWPGELAELGTLVWWMCERVVNLFGGSRPGSGGTSQTLHEKQKRRTRTHPVILEELRSQGMMYFPTKVPTK